MSPSLPHPFRRLGIADQIEQPTQESDAVLSPEAKPRGVRSEGICKGAGVIVGAADCVGHDLSHRLGVLAVGEQIARDTSRPGDGQTPE
jgi:hypothetical protein